MSDDEGYQPSSENESDNEKNDNGDDVFDASEPERPAKSAKLSIKSNATASPTIHNHNPLQKMCANEKCRRPTIRMDRPGPNGTRLCYPCNEAWKAAGSPNEGDEKWKDRSSAVKKAKKDEQRKASKPDTSSSTKATSSGPMTSSGKSSVNPVSSVPKRETTAPLDSTDTPTGKKRKPEHQFKHTCKDCGTHEAHKSHDWNEANGRCDYCHQYHRVHQELRSQGHSQRTLNSNIPNLQRHSDIMITDVAMNSFRDFHPEIVTFYQDDQPVWSDTDYWDLTRTQLVEVAIARGILRSKNSAGSTATVDNLVRWLQIADARNGILPMPARAGASSYHTMQTNDLAQLARDRKYFQQGKGRKGNVQQNESYIKFLVEQDAQRNSNLILHPASGDDMQTAMTRIADSWTSRYASRLDPNYARHRAENMTDAMNRTTHNRGIVGSEQALARLNDDMLSRNMCPETTSGAGLLCGPRALARTFRDMYDNLINEGRALQAWPVNLSTDELMHRMIETLFTNYRRGGMPTDGELGVPTNAYDAYIESRIGFMRDTEPIGYQAERANYLRLNNFEAEQLGAILALIGQGHGRGIPTVNFGLGVVAAAHMHTTDDRRRQQVPTHARIIREGDGNLPVLFLHHNAALAGNYDHFESMTTHGRLDVAFNWGLRTSLSATAKRYKHLPSASEREANMTTQQKLRTEIASAQRRLKFHMDKLAKVCSRCRELDIVECDGESGEPGKPCSQCLSDKSACQWKNVNSALHDAGAAQSVTAKFGEADGDIDDWVGPTYDPNEILERGRKFEPFPEPKVRHFLVIACARMSSHQGDDALRTILTDLTQTIQNYDAMLANGQQQGFFEGRRPGGHDQQLAMRLFTMVIGRRGTTVIPSALGNLQDNFLKAHVRLLEDVLRQNNPNPPEEIHYLMHGIAGLSVPITGWGTRTSGLMGLIIRRDQQNAVKLADRIYLVFVVSPHVVNGNYQAVDPHQPLPRWMPYMNKRLRKFKLLDLIDRLSVRRYREYLFQWHGGPAPHAYPDTQPDRDADQILEAMWNESDWRASWLDDTTTPTDGVMWNRQNWRNTGMH